MALQIKSIPRVFKFEVNSKEITLEDPNKNFTAEEVMTFYSNTYPELTTATVHGPEIENDKAIFEFKTTIGTKG